MADNSGYVILRVNFSGGLLDTSYTMERSIVGPSGPWTVLGENIPLLGERAVYTDTTAPIGVPLWYRATGNQTGQVVTFAETALPALGQVWLKDPLRPWADIPLDFCDTTVSGHVQGCTTPDPDFVWVGLGQGQWTEDVGLFPVLNAEYPADVWARRKFEANSLRFFTKTLDAIDRVYDLFTAGGPLLLQLPDEYGWHDHFIQPGTVTRDYISRDQRRPERAWTVPFVVVDRPIGPAQGTECANWCAVTETYPTYGDFAAESGTFEDLLAGEILCPGGEPADSLTDTFSRTVAGGWGAADTGQLWTILDGPPADFSVNGTAGVITHPVLNIFHSTTAPFSDANVSMRMNFSLNVVPTGDGADFHFISRVVAVTDYYDARVFIAAGGAIMLTLRKRVAGVETVLATFATGFVYVANTTYTVRFSVQGSNLMAKTWATASPEPAAWQATAVDATFPNAGGVGVRTLARAALTNPLPIVFTFDNLVVN